MVDGPVQPEVLDRALPDALPDSSDDNQAREAVTSPTKLIRIASMVRALRRTPKQP